MSGKSRVDIRSAFSDNWGSCRGITGGMYRVYVGRIREEVEDSSE